MNLSQRELSRRLGQSSSYIDKIERGVRRVDVIELMQLCEAIGCDVHEVVNAVAAGPASS